MKLRLTQDNPCLIVLTAIIFLTVYLISEQDANSADNKIRYTKNTYTYKVVDNCKIRADVYRYPDEKVRPAIIWIHGGALIFGSRNSLPSEQLEMVISLFTTMRESLANGDRIEIRGFGVFQVKDTKAKPATRKPSSVILHYVDVPLPEFKKIN